MDVRELKEAELDLAGPALFDLRSRVGTLKALQTELVKQACEGYRVVAAFVDNHPSAVSVAGFRLARNLAYGHYCYVDDFNTLPTFRGMGGGTAVLERVIDIARAEGCNAFHLDSGAGANRYDAHALYFKSGLRITSHHFVLALSGPSPT